MRVLRGCDTEDATGHHALRRSRLSPLQRRTSLLPCSVVYTPHEAYFPLYLEPNRVIVRGLCLPRIPSGLVELASRMPPIHTPSLSVCSEVAINWPWRTLPFVERGRDGLFRNDSREAAGKPEMQSLAAEQRNLERSACLVDDALH